MGNDVAGHPDHGAYVTFTGPARIDKALSYLIGIVEGIEIDRRVNDSEVAYLEAWLESIADISHRHPLNEFVAAVTSALEDRILTEEERDDIRWLYNKLGEDSYYKLATANIQELHGVLAGVLADGVATEAELAGLTEWLEHNDHLRTIYPYDEICSVVTGIMADGVIDENEQRFLQIVFGEFVHRPDSKTVETLPVVDDQGRITALVTIDPEINFSGSCFCFTGASERYKRKELAATVERLGGVFVNTLSRKVDYLVVGADGNPCWAYACYGRKVEAAVELRRAGHGLLIIHEFDFHDAVLDA